MSGFSQVVQFDTLRTVAFGAVTTGYLPLGSPFPHPMRIVKIQNTTNSDIFITDNGLDDRDVVPAGGFTLYDFPSDGSPHVPFVMMQGTQLFIRSAVATTSGNVYVTCIFGLGD